MALTSPVPRPDTDTLPLVVLSHLRWDFVFQRPQHLLSRLAHNRPVLFIEEPVYEESETSRLEISTPVKNVTVARPFMPIGGAGFNLEQLTLLTPMVNNLMDEQGIADYVLWLYTPMALPLAHSLARSPEALIFDCMDELSAFHHAPPDLVRYEQELMDEADLVLTGGPSLYRAKVGRNPHLYCFPSSVDVEHFRNIRPEDEALDQRGIPHPRFGWFGVIDERMDPSLLYALATAHPEWQVIMVGPVVKIDPATLPKHENIHYMGQRQYAELPSYMVGWDVCIQPFARNEATQFISPTKTLEYMASDLPIVSTPITDVAEPYGQIVYLGSTPQEFVAACERALQETPEQKKARVAAGREVLLQTSWDKTASSIEALIAEACLRHSTSTAV